jgi:hypothetical protein
VRANGDTPLAEAEQKQVDEGVKILYMLSVTTQNMLLHVIDHDLVGAEARKFAQANGWGGSAVPSEGRHFAGDDAALPAAIRVLHPSSVYIFADRVELQFGGALDPQGMTVFRKTTGGEGTRDLGNGVWYHSYEDRLRECDLPKIKH